MKLKLVKLRQPKKSYCVEMLEDAIRDVKKYKKDVKSVGFFVRLKDSTIYQIGYDNKGNSGHALIGSQMLSHSVMELCLSAAESKESE